jgi:MarR family transcriptional regulator, temperature-dependent positive regulator of motility
MEQAAGPGSMLLVTRLSRVVYKRATEAALGMTFKEYHSLVLIREHDGMSQQALAEAMHLDANNCVLLLNEVEAAGFAERRRDPTDRRRHLVHVTPEGLSALERADRALESVEDDVLGALDAGERATLRRLLDRALESAPVPASPPSAAIRPA